MSAIRDYVMNHELFCHHDHHCCYEWLDKNRDTYDYRSLLGYAEADLVTAEGARPPKGPIDRARIESLWPRIQATGYGRAVTLTCQELFGMAYVPENFDAITAALQGLIANKSAEQVFDDLVHGMSKNKWTIQDGRHWVTPQEQWQGEGYPESYRFIFRQDGLFEIYDATPIDALQSCTGRSIHTLDELVDGMNAAIDTVQDTGKLAALKLGIAYRRDLAVSDPTKYEAESAFNRIRSRKVFWGGIQQNAAPIDSVGGRALGDYMLHRLFQRARDDDLPMQIHTGYLAGNWGSLNGTKASHLIPVLEKYRNVRFDLFHASWPWTSELGAIAKNYPNVWPDMCWAWAMNPSQSARALSEWLDAVPFNKIFAYGADTGLPWCNVGYSLQAKIGIANVLEDKIAKGFVDQSTAEETADHIMLKNGEDFFGLG